MRKLVYLFLLATACVIGACSDDAPEGLISESKMEDIIYDCHLVRGITLNTSHSEDHKQQQHSYRQAIYRKYDVTEAQFDSSFAYYCRHSEKLHDIYENISDRIHSEILAYGGNIDIMSENGEVGDTTDVWNKGRSITMMPIAPYNIENFFIEADSSYRAGDKFMLDFDCHFVYEEGQHDLVCLLALTLANDSVVSFVGHCTYDGHTTYPIADTDFKGVKSLRGYMMVSRLSDDAIYKSFHMVSVHNIRLIRMHVDEKAYQEHLRRDSIESARKDSIENTNIVTNELIHDEKPDLTPISDLGMPMRRR